MPTVAGESEVIALIKALIEETKLSDQIYWDTWPKDFDNANAILKLAPESQVLAVRQLLNGTTYLMAAVPAKVLLTRLRGQLLRRSLPYTADDATALCMALRTTEDYDGLDRPLLSAIEKYAADQQLPQPAVEAIAKVVDLYADRTDAHRARQITRLKELMGSDTDVSRLIHAGEAWADACLADLEAMPAKQRNAWAKLLSHAATASGAKPGKKWNKTAEQLLDAIQPNAFAEQVARWFALVDKPHTQRRERQHRWQPDPNLMLNPTNADLLKGLAWMTPLRPSIDLARALTVLTLSAYKKVPGVGPRAVSLGNAAVYALGQMPGLDAVGQLALLKVKVKFGTAQKGIDKALNAAAEREGMPRHEIEELAVPAYGLESVGVREEQLGQFTARLVITGTSSTRLQWIKPDGKPQKTVPKAVKDNHAEDLKDLKAAARDIQKMLPAQRDRIDQLFLQQRCWPLDTWRQRYLDHPLVGTLARRLIWNLQRDEKTTAAIWHDQQMLDIEGNAVPLDDQVAVSLWHPIEATTEQIVAWRDRLAEIGVTQPFKQAHREVYLLTDAERNTGVYSNRFASHVIRQHQFNALCGQRGWKNQLRLMVDDAYTPPTRHLTHWGLRAEFWVESIGDEHGIDTNEAGTYLHLATDQVRFYRPDAATSYAHGFGGGYESVATGPGTDNINEPLPLEQIPPLVLSEVMRDVDLFVGVASVGNNPQWQDGGPDGRYRDYWWSYAFSPELRETGKTRRVVLQRLIPRLKIADRCTFDDRFLIVRGDVRTYKIHLGSGNILMEPNDQYLCIVTDIKKRVQGEMFLPFEGDTMLGVILSKAFLLADDKKITDKTILTQIHRKA